VRHHGRQEVEYEGVLCLGYILSPFNDLSLDDPLILRILLMDLMN
jgi:hypothetical protein